VSAPPSHVRLDAATLSAGDAYRLMTSLVTPRPIAWISTVSPEGRHNLAPFSYFQAVCSRPPTIVVSVGSRADGSPKDTLRNILQTGELTVSHVSEPLAEAMNRTAGDYAPDVDEWEIARDDGRLAASPSHDVAAPRVAAAHAALECRLQHAIPLGEAPHGGPSSTLIIARVVCFQVDGGLVRRDGRGQILPLDPAALASVGRMGGIAYARTRDVFELPRPKVP
jgi:flavin reductase (DIM6/NTAB) family NADH-FMN oxidoreductase RutF